MSRPLMRSKKPGPALDLAVVEAVGPAQILEPSGVPVDLAHLHDALDQLVGEAVAGLGVSVKGGRPAGGVHR